MSYCSYTRDHPEDTLNKNYHDTLYGFPLKEDAALFERLILEINQAGLSWYLILKRAPGSKLTLPSRTPAASRVCVVNSDRSGDGWMPTTRARLRSGSNYSRRPLFSPVGRS
jgi:hypothetical protein